MSEPHTPNTSNFTLYPVAWLTVSLTTGIALAGAVDLSWPVWLAVGIVSVILTAVFFSQRYVAVFLFAAFISLGGLSSEIEKLTIAPQRLKVLFDSEILRSGEPFEITGVAETKPELTVGGFFITVTAKNIISKGVERDVSGSVRLFLPVADEEAAGEYEALALSYGTRLRVACELLREERFRNPGGVSTREILDRQGIDATGVVKSPLLLENLGNSGGFPLLGWVYERRQNLIVEFKKYFSVSTAGVLIASLLGNKYHLDRTTAESFREGGTFHILVISGLQITFIGGLAILFLRRVTGNWFWQFLTASAFLWAYTLAVGADAPVTRAAIMFTVWYFAYVVFRQATLLNTLAVSAQVLLIWRPSALFDQSFQLTFMCMLAIVATAVPLLEKLQQIGNWRPRAETPVPPAAAPWLKAFCESLYWSEKEWQRELSRTIWQCRLHKARAAGKLERWKLQKLFRLIFETLLVSLVVQLWLVPLAVVYFHRISLVSIFLNIPVGALMAIESLLAIGGIAIAQVSGILAAPFIWATENLNWLILQITFFFIGFDWSSLRLPHYAGSLRIVYPLYFLPVTLLTASLLRWDPFSLTPGSQRSKLAVRMAVPAFLFLLALIVFHPFSAPLPDGKLRIDFLDVGQGDSALVTMPTGETLLIDGGGRSAFKQLFVRREGEEPEPFEPDVQNIGETVVSNFLWEKGYDKVDYLLATHADTDHLQGLTDVARNFQIRAAMVAATPFSDEDFVSFFDILRKRKIPLEVVKRGDVLNFGDVRIDILHPAPDERLKSVWDNNHSIVLRIVFGETTFLLTGDIERETEKQLLEEPELLRANVVKAAHHGSKTSSIAEFVAATKAKLTVIPVGKRSPFGHPDGKVVERWQNAGAKVITTGENGTVTVTSSGKSISVETFIQKQVFR